ncbi:MAG: DUF190 domain-containing protein [Chloroflexota bacterium]|nr:DUF190 domain-containing protein [Dehalococcoidia bacterium]MDW8254900.1 DUF190 domain-containing protein [Chloroflexota bacterium]
MNGAAVGKRVRIYLSERDRAPGRHEPLWETVLDLLRREGAAGATVFRALAGFGAHGALRLARLVDVIPDLPVVIEWLDGPQRVERLLPKVRDLVTDGTITVEEIAVVAFPHRAPRSIPAIPVAEVMTRHVETVQPETPAAEVVRLLLGRSFRAVPVVDREGRLLGIVTNHDLIERGGLGARIELLAVLARDARDRELARLQAAPTTAIDLASREVITIAPDASLAEAAHLMASRGLKRLPVVDRERRLLGLLSRVDVLRTVGEDFRFPAPAPLSAGDGGRAVRDVMRRAVPVVRENAPLGEVIDAVTATDLHRAIVVDPAGRVVGIISDADVLARLDPLGQHELLSSLMRRARPAAEVTAQARDVMRSPALTVPPDLSLAAAAQRLIAGKRKVAVVVDENGRFLGALDRAELLLQLVAGREAQGEEQ